jgi:hypothetical protein
VEISSLHPWTDSLGRGIEKDSMAYQFFISFVNVIYLESQMVDPFVALRDEMILS